MNHAPNLILTTTGPESTVDLLDLISSLKDSDPLTPVTVVGPSVYANLSLRHGIGRSGFANVRFMVISRMSELLGAPLLAEQGRRPLTPILETAAVRGVSAEAQGALHNVRHHPATHASLRSSFRELRYASNGGLDRLCGQNDLRREVVRLYRRFSNVTSDYYDREGLALAAAKAVKAGTADGLADLGFLVFYQIRDITPAEREMIEALREIGQTAIFLGLTGDEEADGPVKRLADKLIGTATVPAQQSSPPAEANTRLVIAPDPHQEMRWVIRSIMKKVEAGVPFHRTAVLFRRREPYASLINEELVLAGIPVAGPSPQTYLDTALGRTLMGLLNLVSDGDLARDAVIDWLGDCPVRPPSMLRVPYSPSLWDTVSRKSGLIGGLDQWNDRLTRYSASIRLSAERAENLGDMSEEKATQVRVESDAALDMLEFVRGLAEDIKAPDDHSTWTEFSVWIRGLMERYVVSDTELPESAVATLQGITDRLDGLGSIDELQPRPTLAEFSEAVSDALHDGLGHVGTTGKGVFVAPFGAAAAMSFDTIYLVGMIEGAVPPPISDDPLIPEQGRRSAGGDSEGLPLNEAQRANERFDFLAALAAAPNKVLTYPRADPAGQRGFYPSRWFLEQASKLEGGSVYTSTIWSLTDRPWLTIIPSMEQGLATVDEESAADRHDYILERLSSWKREGYRVSDHPMTESAPLRQALSLGRQRNSSRLTEYDGDVSVVAKTSASFGSADSSVFSPTRLERWARCPFSYYLGNILGIAAIDKPEDNLSITPIERGRLIHSILEVFFNVIMNDSSMPKPGQDWSEEHVELLMALAEKAFDEAEARGLTGRRLLWQIEKENIGLSLRAFLDQDSRLREKYGVTARNVEAKFGVDTDSWQAVTVDLPGDITVRFRGVIDRVDVDSSGKQVLVTDYKTGSATPYRGLNKDPLDSGRRLQLPIYSLAVRQHLGDDVDVRAAYWFVTDGARLPLRPSEPLQIDEVLDQFNTVISAISNGIGSGLFPANPGPRGYQNKPENCTYCDFDRLCPSRREVVWERKKSDPRLAAYLELSDEQVVD